MLSPTTTLSFTQKCVACVGTGTVTLAAGNITLISGVENILDSLINPTVSDLASSADISIVFNNFTAEFEFETSIQLTQSFSFHILGEDGIGIPGFSVHPSRMRTLSPLLTLPPVRFQVFSLLDRTSILS